MSVPVPTLPQSTLGDAPGAAIAPDWLLMLLLGAGFVGIVSAMAREAKLGAGETLDPRAKRRGRIAGAIAAVGRDRDRVPRQHVVDRRGDRLRSLRLQAAGRDAAIASGLRLCALTLTDPGWIGSRRVDDFVPDHGHVMHLFVLSPALDRLWHLHPNEVRTGILQAAAAGAARRASTSCSPISFTPPACPRR